jgi:hypothetical protein
MGASHIVAFLTIFLFPCVCGHLDFYALPTSIIGVAIAFYGFSRFRHIFILYRALAVLIPTFVFLKNVADILWFGHDAIL